jgi:hypothetical protein
MNEKQMTVLDFTSLSPLNAKFLKQIVSVANGATFVALDMSEEIKRRAVNVLYLHVQRNTRKCYIGITVQEAGKRWYTGTTYKLNRRFGRALEKYGWDAFDSYILAIASNRDELNQAEIEAISAAGGHKSQYTYNLSPGGDAVSENDIPIVGVYLPTGESKNFKSGSEASRVLGFRSTDTPMAVVRGQIVAAKDWWFRLANDSITQPPKSWGKAYKSARIRELKAKPIEAVNFESGELLRFESMEDAANALGVQPTEVGAVAHGKAHSAGGWWFRFEQDDRTMPELHGHKATRAKRDIEVYAVNLETGERLEFRNCTVADKKLGLYKGASAAVASGERVSAVNWWFSYSRDENPPTEYKGALVAKARSKPVVATSIDTGIEQIFDSAKVAADALGMSRSLICLAIQGKRKSAKGYQFRFA